jgi:hypothetical protein
MALKHIGRMASNGKKVVVAYRVIPNDADNCLIIATENLDADQHDSLMKLVESPMGQDAYELAEAMARSTLPDGRNMLAGLHYYGKLTKVPTTSVEMTPDSRSAVNLAELNQLIATQKGVTVNDLALQSNKPKEVSESTTVAEETVVTNTVSAINEVLTDDQLAAQYRSQADALYKEAKKLREQAEQLAPTKKKSKESDKQEV